MDIESAIIETLNKLTPRWQSFASDTVTDVNRMAMTRLVVCGFAKTQLQYKVTNSATGEWIKLRYVLSGEFCGDPLMKYTAAQCPPDWFSTDQLNEMPGINVVTQENDWTLAITDDGDRLRKLPGNRWLLLNTVQCSNAKPTIIKEGFEQGRNLPFELRPFNLLSDAASLSMYRDEPNYRGKVARLGDWFCIVEAICNAGGFLSHESTEKAYRANFTGRYANAFRKAVNTKINHELYPLGVELTASRGEGWKLELFDQTLP